MLASSFIQCILLCISFISLTMGVYLPGVAPIDFQEGDEIELKVNKLR